MQDKLLSGNYYHIYNRGNNGENIFIEERNYKYFMDLYKKYIFPITQTYAFCLLKNHFHFLIKIKEEKELKNLSVLKDLTGFYISKQFSNFFNSYSKSINKSYNRTGSLFEKPFKRKLIEKDNYLTHLVYYIHNNPIKHGFMNKLSDYQFSSYNVILSDIKTNLKREDVLAWFSGKNQFIEYHLKENNDHEIYDYIIE